MFACWIHGGKKKAHLHQAEEFTYAKAQNRFPYHSIKLHESNKKVQSEPITQQIINRASFEVEENITHIHTLSVDSQNTGARYL